MTCVVKLSLASLLLSALPKKGYNMYLDINMKHTILPHEILSRLAPNVGLCTKLPASFHKTTFHGLFSIQRQQRDRNEYANPPTIGSFYAAASSLNSRNIRKNTISNAA